MIASGEVTPGMVEALLQRDTGSIPQTFLSTADIREVAADLPRPGRFKLRLGKLEPAFLGNTSKVVDQLKKGGLRPGADLKHEFLGMLWLVNQG